MDNETRVLLQAMRTAGDAILHLQRTGFTVETKTNRDLVTQADLLANDIITAHLGKHFPDDGCLSEESKDDLARLSKKRVWIIDPIDGTIEFAKGLPEYAISVALVENNEPIVAAIFNPATNELFHAVKGKGAWLHDQRIHCDEESPSQLRLLASRSEYQRGEWASYEPHHCVQQIGSIAYKLALVAAGFAHATFSLGPKNEWDVVAGVLLVKEAGGVVSDKHKQALLFNQRNVLQDSIVATTASSEERIFALLGE
jgi:myo-inositol-1(or 4)-monophosphatase